MDKEQIIHIVREAGLGGVENWEAVDALVQAAYAAGAAAEREECAKVCEELWHVDGTATAKEFADAIRARGQI